MAIENFGRIFTLLNYSNLGLFRSETLYTRTFLFSDDTILQLQKINCLLHDFLQKLDILCKEEAIFNLKISSVQNFTWKRRLRRTFFPVCVHVSFVVIWGSPSLKVLRYGLRIFKVTFQTYNFFKIYPISNRTDFTWNQFW